MASLGGNLLPYDADNITINKVVYGGIALAIFSAIGFAKLGGGSGSKKDATPNLLKSLLLFCYSCFLKPHRKGSSGTQQDALESFYAAQAGIYDVTRKTLLKGREDMLALVAAQLKFKAGEGVEKGQKGTTTRGNGSGNADLKKRVWVDVGGGTGWNIEAMSAYVNVPEFFSSVYLVDFSPSLCEVARQRFARLGWSNVHVICQDARKFKLADYEDGNKTPTREHASPAGYFSFDRSPETGGADLVTMSYSLSMMPDYFSIVDSMMNLIAADGIYGVVDFYAQSKVDFSFRNFTAGLINRHVNFLSRSFWRAWFDLDRVNLDASRRDYLEYRFGTVLGINGRNTTLGNIPYYIWVGCQKKPFHPESLPHEVVERVDAIATESPYLSSTRPAKPASPATALSRAVQRTAPELRSKAFQTAIANLSHNLPLPSFFYQNHHWRIYYDDTLQKHTQFNDEYIYAFTWEDTRADERLLRLGADDVVLAITSAGDNILSYALQGPARIHAVDLNPSQNHLLELKVASYAAQLPYDDFWRIFGEGKHPSFRRLLIDRLSPHLSSRAFQYWLANSHIFTTSRGGLYDTGGSKWGIRIFYAISLLFGCRSAVRDLLDAPTLAEQREIWHARIRPALMHRLVARLVVSQEAFLWTALGVPKNQLALIEQDHASAMAAASASGKKPSARNARSHAIWRYMVDTLDPVVENTHIAADNPYYHVCLEGKFSRRCHPDYLSPAAHARLSRPRTAGSAEGPLDGLRIHTDEIQEVLARFTPGALTVAVVMDSMDWFDAATPHIAGQQVAKLNRALRMGGRVMLRSSALEPWYLKEFERLGFVPKRAGERVSSTSHGSWGGKGNGKAEGIRERGECIDRVNMYASTWICTKVANLPPPTPGTPGSRVGAEDGVDELVI